MKYSAFHSFTSKYWEPAYVLDIILGDGDMSAQKNQTQSLPVTW